MVWPSRIRCTGLLAMVCLAASLRAQSPMPPSADTLRTPHFELVFAIEALADCPAKGLGAQRQLFGDRLEATSVWLREQLALAEPPVLPPRLRLALVADETAAREFARGWCQVELQQRGVVAASAGSSVLWIQRGLRSDAELWRASAHLAVQCLVLRELPTDRQSALGCGWLATGLAHVREATVGGAIDTFVTRDVVQPPHRFFAGDFVRGAAELLARGQLPALTDLLATAADDFDFAQHAAAFALVDWLLVCTGAPVTHGAGTAPVLPLLAQVLAAARAGEASTKALPRLLGGDLPTIARWGEIEL